MNDESRLLCRCAALVIAACIGACGDDGTNGADASGQADAVVDVHDAMMIDSGSVVDAGLPTDTLALADALAPVDTLSKTDAVISADGAADCPIYYHAQAAECVLNAAQVDQNQPSTGVTTVSSDTGFGQLIQAQATGWMVGFEVSVLRTGLAAMDDELRVTVYSGTSVFGGIFVGTATVRASTIPNSAGLPPALDVDAPITAGYFDLSALNIIVQPNQSYLFIFDVPSGGGARFVAPKLGDLYAPGEMFIGGTGDVSADTAFRTWVVAP